MTADEFKQWVDGLVSDGRLTAAERDDLWAQRQRFEESRGLIELQARGRYAGSIGGELIFTRDVEKLLDYAREQGRQLYYEKIPYH